MMSTAKTVRDSFFETENSPDPKAVFIRVTKSAHTQSIASSKVRNQIQTNRVKKIIWL